MNFKFTTSFYFYPKWDKWERDGPIVYPWSFIYKINTNNFCSDETETSCFVVGQEDGFSYFSVVITQSLYKEPSRYSSSLLRVLFLTQKKKMLVASFGIPINYTLSSPSAILTKTGVRLMDGIVQHKLCGTLWHLTRWDSSCYIYLHINTKIESLLKGETHSFIPSIQFVRYS